METVYPYPLSPSLAERKSEMTYIITAWRPSELGERGRTYDDYIEANIPMDSAHFGIESAEEANEMATALTLIGWDVMVEALDVPFYWHIEQVKGEPYPVPRMLYTREAQHPGFDATIEDATVVVQQSNATDMLIEQSKGGA